MKILEVSKKKEKKKQYLPNSQASLPNQNTLQTESRFIRRHHHHYHHHHHHHLHPHPHPHPGRSNITPERKTQFIRARKNTHSHRAKSNRIIFVSSSPRPGRRKRAVPLESDERTKERIHAETTGYFLREAKVRAPPSFSRSSVRFLLLQVR